MLTVQDTCAQSSREERCPSALLTQGNDILCHKHPLTHQGQAEAQRCNTRPALDAATGCSLRSCVRQLACQCRHLQQQLQSGGGHQQHPMPTAYACCVRQLAAPHQTAEALQLLHPTAAGSSKAGWFSGRALRRPDDGSSSQCAVRS